MFIREKKNKSGSISIQVLEKKSGRNILIKTIGSSSNAEQIEQLKHLAKDYIDHIVGQLSLPISSNDSESSGWFELVQRAIKKVQLLGPELVLGKLYDEIGFNQIQESLFRHLVLSRIIYPSSKLKTTRYLLEYEMREYSVDKIYRYMDKLEEQVQTQVEQISYDHTKSILSDQMSIVFYDVTTIYFEAEKEDELRQTGFSKEGKHKHPQILLGLLVSVNGYPLAYEIFTGNKYEGHTMLPVIDAFKKRFALDKLVIIADAGLLTQKNIEQLIKNKQEFILGARLKSEKQEIKQQILSDPLGDQQTKIIHKSDDLRLIVSYTEKRAKRDAYNRQRGLKRLEKSLAKGKLTKGHLNKRGYNKYLKLTGELNISIDYEKYEQSARWDGLKGYITNTQLDAKTLIDNYNELWRIERAFRISKTDLRIRPVYHRLQRRIQAHICISFTAYKVFKELQRQLIIKDSTFSTHRTIELLKTIYGIKLQHPVTNQVKLVVHTNNQQQEKLLKLFNINLG